MLTLHMFNYTWRFFLDNQIQIKWFVLNLCVDHNVRRSTLLDLQVCCMFQWTFEKINSKRTKNEWKSIPRQKMKPIEFLARFCIASPQVFVMQFKFKCEIWFIVQIQIHNFDWFYRKNSLSANHLWPQGSVMIDSKIHFIRFLKDSFLLLLIFEILENVHWTRFEKKDDKKVLKRNGCKYFMHELLTIVFFRSWMCYLFNP